MIAFNLFVINFIGNNIFCNTILSSIIMELVAILTILLKAQYLSGDTSKLPDLVY